MAQPPSRMPHAFVMMLLIITKAVVLTYVVPSEEFSRSEAGLVEPGTYRTVEKEYSMDAVLGLSNLVGLAMVAIAVAVLIGY
jgi:uncharacterized ion transporter superfamily protein YfcC